MSGASARPGSTKPGRDLRVGDVLGSIRGERSRTITRLEPYPSPERFTFMDERWRIAHSGDWGITIDPDAHWRLAEDGTWGTDHHIDEDGRWIA